MEFWMRYITILDKNSKLLSVLTSKRAEAEDLARFTVPIISVEMFPNRRLTNYGNQEHVDFAKTCCVCFVSRLLILRLQFWKWYFNKVWKDHD